MDDNSNILNLIPKNVKLVYYDSLIPNKEYCIFRNDPCYYSGIYRKCYGTFSKNEYLKSKEICSRFNNFRGIGDSVVINNYPTINPLKNNVTQKFYFFEKRYLPNIDEQKKIEEMRWYVIQNIFLDPEFRKNILGSGLEYLGSINISSLKLYFIKN